MTENTRKKCVKWFWIIVSAPIALIFTLLLLVWAFADIPSFEELEDLSPYLVQAAVATEDQRFYRHSGIDFPSLGRVLVKTLLLSDSSQGGGSTITQQLAKTLYPRADVSSRIPGFSKVKMVWIKLKEWITAVKL